MTKGAMDKDYKAHLQYKKQIAKMSGQPKGKPRANTRQGHGMTQSHHQLEMNEVPPLDQNQQQPDEAYVQQQPGGQPIAIVQQEDAKADNDPVAQNDKEAVGK